MADNHRSTKILAVATAAAFSSAAALFGQTPVPAAAPAIADASLPLRLDLSRRDLKNFLVDKDAALPYRMADGSPGDLRDVFALGSVEEPWAVFWDPLACRLLGILDLEAPPEETAPPVSAAAEGEKAGAAETNGSASPYLLKASGAFPLAKTPGGSGTPRYFGFRLVEGAPEFLYTCGPISIEERLWLDEGAKVLRQRFVPKNASRGLLITVPDDWKGRVEASAGTWKDNVLTVPKEATEVVLTYPLAPAKDVDAPKKPDPN